MSKIDKDRIIDNLFEDYLEQIQEYRNDKEILTKIDTLKDNGLATKIAGDCDLLSPRFDSLYVICKYFIDHNKELKKYIRKLTGMEDSIIFKLYNNNEETMELLQYLLENGIYYMMLGDETSTDYAILKIEDDPKDEYYTHYELYIVGRKATKNKYKFLKRIDEYSKKCKTKQDEYIEYTNNKPRQQTKFKSFDKMVLKDKDKYIKYIDNWVDSIPKFYEYDMIPKLSILLYGEPGVGKSTFCRALANHLGINVIKTITPDYFDNSFSKSWNDDDYRYSRNMKIQSQSFTPYICNIDDLDCIGNSRDDDSSLENGQVVSKLLEFLDNPPTFAYKAKDGKYYYVSIVCATTNYYDRLDDAVKRFGRFDLTIKLDKFNLDEAEEMCSIYGLTLSQIYKEPYDTNTEFNPAHIQALCMENIDKSLKHENK